MDKNLSAHIEDFLKRGLPSLQQLAIENIRASFASLRVATENLHRVALELESKIVTPVVVEPPAEV